MPKMIAFLRGINVGGKVLKMDAVRASFESAGLDDVQTYIQSGNVIFTSSKPSSALAKKLENQLLNDSDLAVSVILKSPDDLAKIIKKNPFLVEGGVDLKSLHVTLLAEVASKANLPRLAAIKSGKDRYVVASDVVYVCCPDGYGRTKLNNNAIEKALGVVATTRNWATVGKIIGIAGQKAESE